jgi:hypothetical protein
MLASVTLVTAKMKGFVWFAFVKTPVSLELNMLRGS